MNSSVVVVDASNAHNALCGLDVIAKAPVRITILCGNTVCLNHHEQLGHF
jgi:hypothetical protein